MRGDVADGSGIGDGSNRARCGDPRGRLASLDGTARILVVQEEQYSQLGGDKGFQRPGMAVRDARWPLKALSVPRRPRVSQSPSEATSDGIRREKSGSDGGSGT